MISRSPRRTPIQWQARLERRAHLRLLPPPGWETAEDLGAQPWDASIARQLIGALIHRVAAAANATPDAQRLDAHTLLAEADAALWAAYAARNLPALRRAIAAYESAAAPIFERYRASR
jgi:hypothetical protein